MASLTDEQKGHLKSVLSNINERGVNWPKTEEWQGDSGKRKKFQEVRSKTHLIVQQFLVIQTILYFCNVSFVYLTVYLMFMILVSNKSKC